MRKVLSIDFDYFIDTDLYTRNMKFPDGVDEKSQEELERDWSYFYNEYPEISNIGVINQYRELKKAFEDNKITYDSVMVALSHKDIWTHVLSNKEDSYEVTNIDFHHDNYISSGSKVDCANWVRHLMNDPKNSIKWLCREDSERVSLEGEFPYFSATPNNLYLEGHYDDVFLCLSPEWTPPHLTPLYEDLVSSIIN